MRIGLYVTKARPLPAEALLASPFAALPDIIRAHAAEHPGPTGAGRQRRGADVRRAGRADGSHRVRLAARRCALRRGGRDLCPDLDQLRFGVLAAGAAVAPLAQSSTPTSFMMMLKDSGARVFMLDRETPKLLQGTSYEEAVKRVALDGSEAGEAFSRWLGPEGAKPACVSIAPDQPFNIIYSSGTTGAPKGIVQPHRIRFGQFLRTSYRGAVTIVSTRLYSNTTLVVFFPTLAHGGTAVLMPKFDAGEFLRLSERHRATHAMLVPVQYRRIMEREDFGEYDLSSYVLKLSASAPFPQP